MQPVMESESGSGSKGLVLDRRLQLIDPDETFWLERINEREMSGMSGMKRKRKKRNGGLRSRIQEQDQTWRRKVRVRLSVTDIAMLIMMLIGLVNIGALLINGSVTGNGLGI